MTWRAEILVRLPWIERLDDPVRCDDYRWSSMSIKAARSPELREKYHCRRSAVWHFTGLDPYEADQFGFDVGRSGTYCYSHLVNQAFMPEREDDRYQKWARANVDLIEQIKSGTALKLIRKRRRSAAHNLSDEA